MPTNNSDEYANLDQVPQLGNGNFSDPSDFLASEEGMGQYIDIFHIPSNESVRFKAYIKDYSDDYRSEWSDEKVYGRMDPIVQFQGTSRVISLDWDVVASSREEAVLNHKKCSLLFSMLYPSYEQGGASATLINTAPLFKVKFGNLIQDPTVKNEGESVGLSARDNGLVGTITGFTYKPDFEVGFVDPVGEEIGMSFSKTLPPLTPPTFKGTPGTMLPKVHSLAMEFTVLHTAKLGWEGKKKRTPSFPHGGQQSRDSNQGGQQTDEGNASAAATILGG